MSTGSRMSSPALRLVLFTLATTAVGAGAVALRAMGTDSALFAQVVLFLYSIPANTGLSLFSHEVALLDYGAHHHIVLSTLSAVLGTVVAGIVDWRFFVPLLGSERLAPYRDRRWVRTLLGRFERAPFLVLWITAASPIPFFPFKMMAFSIGYPLRRYLVALAAARTPRYLAIAWFGALLRPPAWLLASVLVGLLATVLVKEAIGHGRPALRRPRVRKQEA